jgi:hypothetical protein
MVDRLSWWWILSCVSLLVYSSNDTYLPLLASCCLPDLRPVLLCRSWNFVSSHGHLSTRNVRT